MECSNGPHNSFSSLSFKNINAHVKAQPDIIAVHNITAMEHHSMRIKVIADTRRFLITAAEDADSINNMHRISLLAGRIECICGSHFKCEPHSNRPAINLDLIVLEIGFS